MIRCAMSSRPTKSLIAGVGDRHMGNAAGRGGVAFGQAFSIELGIKMENVALAMLNRAKKMMI